MTLLKPTHNDTREPKTNRLRHIAGVQVESHQVLRLVGGAAEQVNARRASRQATAWPG